jgi:drug/metabolite transporter (DMT)-like permease
VRGMTLALIAGSSFAINNILTKLALDATDNVPSVLWLRSAVAALSVWLVVATRRSSLHGGGSIVTVVVIGAIGYAGQSFLFNEALNRTTAGLAIMGLYTYPVIVATIGWLFGYDRPTALSLLAIALGVGGVLLAVAPQGVPMDASGVVLGVVSGLTWAGLVVIIDRTRAAAHPMRFSAIVLPSMSLTLMLLTLLSGEASLPPNGRAWIWILLSGLSMAIGVVAFAACISAIGATRAAIGNTIEPPATVLLAVFVLGETFSIPLALGAGLVVVAMLLIRAEALDRPTREPIPAPTSLDTR